MAEEKKTTTKTATAKASGTKTTAKTTASKTAGAKNTASKTTAAKSGTAKRTSTSKTTVSRSSKPKAAPVEKEEVIVAAPVEEAVAPVEVEETAVPVAETPAIEELTVEAIPVAEPVAEETPVAEESAEAVPATTETTAEAPASETEQAPSEEVQQGPNKEGGKAKKIIWNILRGIGYAVLAFLVIAAGWLAIDKLVMKSTIPQAYGVSALNVKTDSMNGTKKDSFKAGDVIFIWRHPDAENLKVGDVITFWEVDNNGKPMKDKLPTTHRISQVNDDGTYKTWGDGNNAEDIRDVKPENVVGVVLFHIPKAGHFINWISTGGGALYLVAFGALIIGLIYVAKKKDWN